MAAYEGTGMREDVAADRERRAAEAFERIRSGNHWHDWTHVARGFEAGRERAMREARTNEPVGSRYNQAFSRWMAGLAWATAIDKATRNHCFWVIDLWPDIEAWRETLTATQRDKWNHPTTVKRQYERAHRPPKPAVVEEVETTTEPGTKEALDRAREHLGTTSPEAFGTAVPTLDAAHAAYVKALAAARPLPKKDYKSAKWARAAYACVTEIIKLATALGLDEIELSGFARRSELVAGGSNCPICKKPTSGAGYSVGFGAFNYHVGCIAQDGRDAADPAPPASTGQETASHDQRDRLKAHLAAFSGEPDLAAVADTIGITEEGLTMFLTGAGLKPKQLRLVEAYLGEDESTVRVSKRTGKPVRPYTRRG
jgi:hypothetical protein